MITSHSIVVLASFWHFLHPDGKSGLTQVCSKTVLGVSHDEIKRCTLELCTKFRVHKVIVCLLFRMARTRCSYKRFDHACSHVQAHANSTLGAFLYACLVVVSFVWRRLLQVVEQEGRQPLVRWQVVDVQLRYLGRH